MTAVSTFLVDYSDLHHAADMMRLLNEYAQDPMGAGKPLDSVIMETLPSKLASVPGAFSVLGLIDGRAEGLINCLPSFSTFKAMPIVNIHDIIVSANSRGTGLCGTMLDAVNEVALQRGCCKVTLEVLTGNEPAQVAYRKAGFDGYQLDPKMGHALFWEKSLI
ncbi:MAG: GNAT family N-acetyltransferase [Pseudomonadales bacterium]